MAQQPVRTPSSRLDKSELISTVVAALPGQLDSEHKSQLSDFIAAYFSSAPLHELATFTDDDLAGMALLHWQLAQPQNNGEPACHILNPSLAHQGWSSPHTVIQIVSVDQPWLVSSLHAALSQAKHRIHATNHPILGVKRDASGRWITLDGHASKESFIHIEIDLLPEEQHGALQDLIDEIFSTLDSVKSASGEIRQQLKDIEATLEDTEISEFVHWLDESQFACLGAARLQASDEFRQLQDARGILRTHETISTWQVDDLIPNGLTLADLDIALNGQPLVVCKAGRIAPVIRNEPADMILHAIRDNAGKLESLQCIVGVFVVGLQNESISNIPWMRERVGRVIKASGKQPDSHDSKAITSTVQGLPREMLMQTRSGELLDMALGIVSLQERRQVRLFSSNDSMGRFYNCLVYIPSDAYNRELRLKIERILITHIDGLSVGFDTQFSSGSALARLHFVIQKNPPLASTVDWTGIEQRIRQAAISWNDRLESTLLDEHGENLAIELHQRYNGAFPPSYIDRYSARSAVADISFIEKHTPPDAPVMSFYRHGVLREKTVHFKLFNVGHPVPLSDVIPIIENMGLKVNSAHPFEIRRLAESRVWIHEFIAYPTSRGESEAEPVGKTAQRIQTAFDHIWRKSVENDGFNRLMINASLSWRQVVILRAMCKYLLQIGVPFSQDYMIDSLVTNSPITRRLVELFENRFKPASEQRKNDKEQELLAAIDLLLDEVASLDEDRILRSYRNLIMATLRTNAYRQDKHGQRRDFLSFKFDSALIPDLPLPKPKIEIFVYSAKVEGIHLRGGLVARGGLRWSDRREDFRTEVLGLMKAQMVKNAVIVPVGSKGGFVVKAELPEEREQMMAVVVDCYRTFLSGLLDVTDNLDGSRVVPPQDVVRYDSDDPYLVVAADKGTATFSDYANEVANEYGFWLGDAFASGGSVGYDHKKMGITARGAWESVKRHFRNLGINTQTDSFSVVGIGDMAGDVFGNGMLLSGKLKLVAAFNHQHIFIDPDPDSEAAYAERQRLFNLPRSSWSDYDTTLISAGGGVFSRKAKLVELSPQAQQILGISQQKLTPTDLITAILKAPVDLLWNGGIGTYVKAGSETNSDAADRANDSLRVNGRDLRARVVGEGGNLGFTQRGRIEFAQRGGLIYTDAIDNSAGVDCSDHEVNIKILANALVASEDLTLKQRDQLLESMTGDVANLVLKDNYLQTQCIDLCAVDGHSALNEQARFMQYLESINRLDRSIEYLPDNDDIAERMANDQCLLRPELSVLVSYSKMVMFDELMQSQFTADPALESVLCEYFPGALQERFRPQIIKHRLRAEIIATIVTNDLVNRLGPTFAFRMHQELNAEAGDVAAAFVVVCKIFDLRELWQKLEALDNQIQTAEQYRMQILVRGLVERATHWLVRSRKTDSSIDDLVKQYGPGLQALIAAMPACLSAGETVTLNQRIQHFSSAGAPQDTAMAVAQVVPLSSALDIVEIASSVEQPVADVAAIYFALGQHLELSWLRERIGELVATSHWHKLATSELRSDLHYQQRDLCAEVAGGTPQNEAAGERVNSWAQRNPQATDRYRNLITDMKASNSVDFAMLSLAITEVHKLLRSVRPLASRP
ncbi:MAG: NAD-glutamate dehydrogenase [Granulosicoccus sp.]